MYSDMSANSGANSGETMLFCELNRDCLQNVALNLDPASLVSFSLACKTFSCKYFDDPYDMIPRSSGRTFKKKMQRLTVPKEGNVLSENYGILRLPNCILGVGILYQSIKHDYPNLFEYWVDYLGRHTSIIFDNGDDDEESFESAEGYVGAIPTHRCLEWIGRIRIAKYKIGFPPHNFIYEVIKSRDLDKYITLVYEPLSRTVPMTGTLKIEETFRIAIIADALEIAKFIATELSIRVYERAYFKHAYDSSQKIFAWILDKIPLGADIMKLYSSIMGSRPNIFANFMAVLNHPLFRDIEFTEINLSPKDTLTLLEMRPDLIKCVNVDSIILFDSPTTINPLSEKCLKMFPREPSKEVPSKAVVGYSQDKGPKKRRMVRKSLSVGDNKIFDYLLQHGIAIPDYILIYLFTTFPLSDQEFEQYVIKWCGYEEHVIMLLTMCKNTPILQRFIPQILRGSSWPIYTLIGLDIVPDEYILEVIKEKNIKKKDIVGNEQHGLREDED